MPSTKIQMYGISNDIHTPRTRRALVRANTMASAPSRILKAQVLKNSSTRMPTPPMMSALSISAPTWSVIVCACDGISSASSVLMMSSSCWRSSTRVSTASSTVSSGTIESITL
jgi:hypothetical protein